MLQGDFCFVLFCFAKLEIKGNPWLKSAVPDSVMPHHLWCCVTDQSFDFLRLLLDLDLQSHCSSQCQLRTRGWCVLLQHKNEREEREQLGSSMVSLNFLHLPQKREKKQKEKEAEKKTATRTTTNRKKQEGRFSRNQELSQDICVTCKSQLIYGPCVLLCPAESRPAMRAQAARLIDLGFQLNPRSFPFTHSKHCKTFISCASKWGPAAWCQRKVAVFVSHFCEEISHFWAKNPPLL